MKMSDEITVTLLDLLNLSLGTPEIGAVNFNLLHRFLVELVKHFALARKQINISDDIAIQTALEETRLMGITSQSNLLSSFSEADGKRSIETKSINDSVSPSGKDEEGSTAGEMASAGELGQKDGITLTNQDDIIATAGESTVEDEEDKRSVNEKDNKTVNGKDDEKKEKNDETKQDTGYLRLGTPSRASRRSAGTSRTDILKRSFLELSPASIYQLERKISILSAKVEALGATPTNMEIAQQARDLQRESGTTINAAGDMWQTMNIVRRIEVTEGAINGITAMLDDISQQVKNMKENLFEQRLDELSSEIKNVTKMLEERPTSIPREKTADVLKTPEVERTLEIEKTPVIQQIMRPPEDSEISASHGLELKELQRNLEKVEKMMKGMVLKKDLKLYLTVDQLNEMDNKQASRAGSGKSVGSAGSESLQITIDRETAEKPEIITEMKGVEVLEATTEKEQVKETEVTNETQEPTFLETEEFKEPDVHTVAMQELSTKIQNYYDFRRETTRKIDDINEILANSVNKSALMDLKAEISQLVVSQARPSTEKQETKPFVFLQDFQELKAWIEEKLHESDKGLEEIRNTFFPFYEMKETIVTLKDCDELLKCDMENIRKQLLKIVKQLNDEHDVRQVSSRSSERKQSFNISENEEFHLVRLNLLELKSEVDKCTATLGEILDDQSKKQLHLEALCGHIDHLENVKADKQQVNRELDIKVDRKELEKMVNQDQFYSSMSGLDQSVQDLVQKFAGHEGTLRQAISHITADVNSKLDKVALDPVKDYFEDRLGDLLLKLEKKTTEDTNSAAGTRLLVQNANCISCDRPVNVYQENPKLPSLPYEKSFPGTKSFRPFTTFELDGVREQMFQGPKKEFAESLGQDKVQNELIKLGALKNAEDLPELPNRPCGGNHTLTCAEKRTAIRVNKAYREDLHFIAQLSQKDLSIVDILGYDGHVYKGHVTHLPAIPEIPRNAVRRQSASASARPKTGSPI